MSSLGLIFCLNSSFINKCEIYVEAKITKKTCVSVKRETELLSLIHTNLEDLKQIMTRGGKKYYVTFIYDFSRYKDKAYNMFFLYKTEIENQLNKKIKRVRSDRGDEYVLMNDYCEKGWYNT
jgi:hypothetical protein